MGRMKSSVFVITINLLISINLWGAADTTHLHTTQDTIALLKSSVAINFIAKADLVIEGRVISATGFMPDKGRVFTSAIVQITKMFKGTVKDSLVELVYYGGSCDGIILIDARGGFGLSKDMEGIFALLDNKTDNKLAKGLQSYFEPIEYIKYLPENIRGPGNHTAYWAGNTYDDLEKEVFQPIEAITRQKRKVFGQNMFERPRQSQRH
ncbi:MAG: hypothetical protein JWO06_2627 [Bacteroidota bacterium]|nr:hypothetical protein [Bacteroidota bacterium]